MQFNSETNGLDLYTDCRFLCGLETGDGGGTPDTTSYPIKMFTRNANLGLDRVTMLIFKADGWTYDDSNQTGELLDVSNNLVSGTQKVALSVTWLTRGRVRIKDPSGNWITLDEVPRRQQTDSQLTASSGTPSSYYVLGNYLYFDKAPNYSQTGGIEMQFQRGASYFAYTDTTKTPGFASPFHRLVSYYAALDFCEFQGGMEDRAAKLRNRIGSPPDLMNQQPGSGMEKELVDYYSRRDDDAKVALIPQQDDYGQMALNQGNGLGSDTNPRGF